MIRKPQQKLSVKMFECAESSFKAKPKQKKKKEKTEKKNRKEKIKHPRGNHYTFNLLSLF